LREKCPKGASDFARRELSSAFVDLYWKRVSKNRKAPEKEKP